MKAESIELLSKSHHRNGVCGDPFDCFVFNWDDEGTKRKMLGVDFGGEAFAVFDIDLLAKGDICFGSNSFRGDHFWEAVRCQAETMEWASAPGAFFLVHGKRH